MSIKKSTKSHLLHSSTLNEQNYRLKNISYLLQCCDAVSFASETTLYPEEKLLQQSSWNTLHDTGTLPKGYFTFAEKVISLVLPLSIHTDMSARIARTSTRSENDLLAGLHE